MHCSHESVYSIALSMVDSSSMEPLGTCAEERKSQQVYLEHNSSFETDEASGRQIKVSALFL